MEISTKRKANGPHFERPSVKERRAATACFTCKSKKVKCSGEVPCSYCAKRNLECRLPALNQRRLYLVSKVRELEDRVAIYEGRVQEHSNQPTPEAAAASPHPAFTKDATEDSLIGPTSTTAIPVSIPAVCTTPTPTPIERRSSSATFPEDTSSTPHIQSDSTMSSSQNFGSRVQTLLGQKSLQRSVPSLFPISRPPLSKVLTTPRSPSSPKLPTDADAHRYLDAVAFYIGHSQYHFDPREFCDKLAFFYANLDDEAQKHSLWYLQLLLVLAIGKLFLGELDGEQVPGRSMFDYAVDILPNLSEMQSHGVLGIEVLALVAVYLQNADRKEEAYVYHGFTFSYFARIASPFNHQTLVKIGERSYKSTVVDHIHARKAASRRLAAATGNPMGIQDGAIDIDPPFDSPGFSSAIPMKINLELAQLTGRVLSTVYCRAADPEEIFVQNVQNIIRSIFAVGQNIPRELSRTTSTSTHSLEAKSAIRVEAYLYMNLYQVIILTIRPILLHLANTILDNNDTPPINATASPLYKIARTCIEAARRDLEVLSGLKRQNILAIFGFFDLDAIFSAAFIMILAVIIDAAADSSHKSTTVSGIEEALHLLRYLVNHQNQGAALRKQEIERMCMHLGLQIGRGTDIQSANAQSKPANESRPNDGIASLINALEAPLHGDSHTGSTIGVGGQALIIDSSAAPNQDPLTEGLLQNSDTDFSHAAHGGNTQSLESQADLLDTSFAGEVFDLYSAYHNQPFLLTGADTGDFEELERMITGSITENV